MNVMVIGGGFCRNAPDNCDSRMFEAAVRQYP